MKFWLGDEIFVQMKNLFDKVLSNKASQVRKKIFRCVFFVRHNFKAKQYDFFKKIIAVPLAFPGSIMFTLLYSNIYI